MSPAAKTINPALDKSEAEFAADYDDNNKYDYKTDDIRGGE